MTKLKIYSTVLFCIFFQNLFSQVGVNNSNPQQALHVSGFGVGSSQPVIQIDGLNFTNNTAHEDANSQKRLFATSDGDLLILGNNQTNVSYRSSAISTITIPAGAETIVSTYSFALEYPSVVHFEARPTLYIDASASAALTRINGQARQIGFYYKFTAAPSGVTTNKSFGNTVMSWVTYTPADTDQQYRGDYIFNPKKELSLPKGNYTVSLCAFVQNGDVGYQTNFTSQSSQNMRVSISPVVY
ncbi:hypothetical protein LNP04_14040 [Chryseobacterium sp. C-71]|uniref:hypothetical protein n=1 Tax=Chryseobacterium sp. C-71 TaxID=2893882 RepID=UPI001E31F86D|nr:hypothetical protein [Chryseobacterium sp. C-71]UFH31088.1 hypothetical protein LNP04_14040 [Chryseobacterium sp. C-71]